MGASSSEMRGRAKDPIHLREKAETTMKDTYKPNLAAKHTTNSPLKIEGNLKFVKSPAKLLA